MVANVSIDSAAVSLLTAYNMSQEQLGKVQNAVATGYDVSKASDSPLLYLQSQTLKNQAAGYNTAITQLQKYKAQFDRLQASATNVTATANKVRDIIAGISTSDNGYTVAAAAKNIQQYLKNIASMLAQTNDCSDIHFLNDHKTMINISPNATLDYTAKTPNANVLTYTNTYLAVDEMLPGIMKSAVLDVKNAGIGNFTMTINGTSFLVSIGTATLRAALLTSVSNWINSNLTQAAANVGVFSNMLDDQLKMMHTNQDSYSAQADALIKTDLTKDSAQSTALSTQQQLLTSLLSMSNQRMSTVLSLFR